MMAQMEAEVQTLEQQWQLRLERVRYEAARAQRQYDQVEPENRLVARQLEQQWEGKLRQMERTEQEYQRWRQQQALTITEAEQDEILALGTDLPQLWHSATTTATDRKQIVRFLLRDVIIDQKRETGRTWLQLNWQTGARSEYSFRRKVHDYQEYADVAALRQRLQELNQQQKMDAEIAAQLNAAGFVTALGQPFQSKMVFTLRKKWQIPTVKINGNEPNPRQWPDGSYSIQGVAEALEVAPITVFAWLRRGKLTGEQLSRGMPWKIRLTDEQINTLKATVRRINLSPKEAL